MDPQPLHSSLTPSSSGTSGLRIAAPSDLHRIHSHDCDLAELMHLGGQVRHCNEVDTSSHRWTTSSTTSLSRETLVDLSMNCEPLDLRRCRKGVRGETGAGFDGVYLFV